jgi:negative regulator of genetic competence, sporulation and motility
MIISPGGKEHAAFDVMKFQFLSEVLSLLSRVSSESIMTFMYMYILIYYKTHKNMHVFSLKQNNTQKNMHEYTFTQNNTQKNMHAYLGFCAAVL